MREENFDKNITFNKTIFTCETIQQFYLLSFILEERGLTDTRELKDKVKIINRYEVELTDKNNKKKRYIYNEKTNKIQIKTNF